MYIPFVGYTLALIVFFTFLKQYQIHLDKSGTLQPIHPLLCIRQTAENGNFLFPFASQSRCCRSPLTRLQLLPRLPWLVTDCWTQQMADGAGTAVSYALQQFQSDLGVSCLAVQEPKAKGAALLYPMSQRRFLSSFKICILLGISQNRHLQVHKLSKSREK